MTAKERKAFRKKLKDKYLNELLKLTRRVTKLTQKQGIDYRKK